MRVTWVGKVEGHSGQAAQTRDEKEAARLVLELLLKGRKRYQIIIDGVYLGDKGTDWIWKVLNL